MLDSAAMAILAEDARMQFLEAGEPLLVQGGVGDYLYVVSEGCLEVQIHQPQNPPVTAAWVWPGAMRRRNVTSDR
jgi:CRP-like cAMP-binding protein